MSLVVWLPLTQDLRQQGLSNVTVTNNGATYASTGGKLGGCYTFDGNDYIRISMPSSMTTILGCTVAAWVKSTSSTLALGGISQDLSNYTAPCVTLYTSGWQFTSTARSGYGYVSGGTVANTSVWHHVVCTVDDSGNIKTYLNGAQVASSSLTTLNVNANTAITSSNFIEIGCDHPGGDEYLIGSVNDFRIYDHCLSPMEVKELAKGLVLHYPLNRQGWGQENLIKEANALNLNRPFTNSDYSSRGAYVTCPANTNTIVLAQTGTFNCYRWFNGNATLLSITSEELLTPGQPWVFSLDIKSEVQGKFNLWMNIRTTNSDVASPNIIGNAVVVNGTDLPSNWTRYWVSITPRAEDSARVNLLIGISGEATTNGTIYFKNLKFEKGTIMTPWCPSNTEALATTMGLNSTTEYDCSGFCNNGTRTGAFSWTSDTPKYAVSQVFNGSQYIVESNEINTTDSTIALWIKSALSANAHVLDARNSSEVGKQPIYQYTNGSIQTGGNNVYVTTNTGLLVANTWVHIVLVQSGNSLLVYKNGVLFQTLSCTNSPVIKPTIGARLNFSNKFTGQLSDFRIYATALSADDVKSLYQNCATIDPDGTIRGQIRS